MDEQEAEIRKRLESHQKHMQQYGVAGENESSLVRKFAADMAYLFKIIDELREKQRTP